MSSVTAELLGLNPQIRDALAELYYGSGAGAPVDGTSGTGAGVANIGALYVDETNGKIYINTNTKASPTWNDAAGIATADIADLAVTTAKLAADAVNGTKLADDAVDSEHIAAGAIDNEHFAAGVITNTEVSATAAIARSKLAQDALVPYKIPLTDFLAEDGAELGIVEDAADLYRSLASNVVTLLGRTPQTATEAAAATAQFSLPAEYEAGETVTVRVTAQFINGAGVDAGRLSTIDVEVYEQAAGAVGADISATAAQAFTADDTYETFDFTVTPTTLVAGDLLNVVVTASAVADDANPTQIQIGEVAVLCDVRG